MTKTLPIIIVGAGPCGLVTALTLKKYNVPFVIIEKASRSKICSNAGSGFELAPTAVDILQNRLGIDVTKIMSYYQGMAIVDNNGKLIRHSRIPDGYTGGSANRADMQIHLLDQLFPSPKDEEGVLFCGSGLETYRELHNDDPDGGRVVATLSSGEEISGCVLLACDGIRSRVRAVMHGGYDSTKDWKTNTETANTKDPLHFCNTIVYWGKTKVPRGSALELEFTKTQMAKKAKDNEKTKYCTSFAFTITTPSAPASFFIIPSQNGTELNWAVSVQSETDKRSKNNDGTDLTRRGGGPLTEAEKKRLFDFTSDKNSESVVRGITNFPLIQELFKMTPASDITEAGLFDRENLDLPYASESKRVALLGDSAHPQTPFLGQGVNMAIVDAYVYATNLAVALKTKKKSLEQSISDCTTGNRHGEAKKLVEDARIGCTMMTSQNIFLYWFMFLFIRLASTSSFMNQIISQDKSNSDFLKLLDEEHCSPKEQESMSQMSA